MCSSFPSRANTAERGGGSEVRGVRPYRDEGEGAGGALPQELVQLVPGEGAEQETKDEEEGEEDTQSATQEGVEAGAVIGACRGPADRETDGNRKRMDVVHCGTEANGKVSVRTDITYSKPLAMNMNLAYILN